MVHSSSFPYVCHFSKNLTGTPFSMQLIHWILGSSAILIFWRFSPFNLITKTLFTFGYFPFWEYYVISRHYVIAELFLFIFCSIYPLRRTSYIPFALCIGLLANTQAMAWSLSFCILVTLLFDWFFDPYQKTNYMKGKYWVYDLTISIFICLSLVLFGDFGILLDRKSVV